MAKEKLVFISSIASPNQVRFCYALRKYFDAEFWFYDTIGHRAEFWKVDLGDHCKILPGVKYKSRSKYYAPTITQMLKDFDPDIVMLGGFSIPSNITAFRWAKRNKKKTAVFSELSRDKDGNYRGLSPLWRALRFIYRKVDLIMAATEEAIPQYRDTFGFGDKVVHSQYAGDLGDHFKHTLRQPKKAYTYMFPNRMIEIYNPIGAIEIFAEVLARHPGSRLHMNATGDLRPTCEEKIQALGISESVEFLDNIKSWSELHKEYQRCDILIFPATFSNGNFTIRDCMASGMGIVLSNKILGSGKFIKHGKNGFNCEPTKEEFIKWIEEYIKKPELLTQHAALNRQIIYPFSSEGTADLFVKQLGLIKS